MHCQDDGCTKIGCRSDFSDNSINYYFWNARLFTSFLIVMKFCLHINALYWTTRWYSVESEGAFRWQTELWVQDGGATCLSSSCNHWFELLTGKPINCATRVGYESKYSGSTGVWKKQNTSSSDVHCLPFYYIFMCYEPGLTSSSINYLQYERMCVTCNISHLQYSWYKPVAGKCQWYKRH
jgi:hypothetical protein